MTDQITKVQSKGLTLNHETQQLLKVGQQRGWDCLVLGRAPMPEKPLRVGDWLIVPAMEDSSEIPDRTMQRIQAIFAAGIRPKGFLIVHEAPMQLTSGEEASPADKPSPNWAGAAIGIVPVVAAIATAVFTALGLATAATGLLVAAAVVDPILVAVTEDDTWIEIDRWWH